MQKAQQPLRFTSLHNLRTIVLRCGIVCIVPLLLLSTVGCAATPPPPAPASNPQQEPQTAPTPSIDTDCEFIERSFDWTYWRFDEITWNWTVKIPTSMYLHYKD
ncbi:MAG: hypothetical protein JW846_08450, partial [Dehalococcoidia bacterium]|nr:hypothetical protein [Dehalococcoidia bacterium]